MIKKYIWTQEGPSTKEKMMSTKRLREGRKIAMFQNNKL
jgi:hypothetical protein